MNPGKQPTIGKGTFVAVLIVLTGIMLSQFIWLYSGEMINKGIPMRDFLKLFAALFVTMLPLPAIVSVFIAQLIASIQRPQLSAATLLRRQLPPASIGSVALFLLMSFVIPPLNRASFALLYDMRKKRADEAVMKRSENALFDDAMQTMTLPRLMEFTSAQKEAARSEFILHLNQYYDLPSANKLLTRSNIDFFSLADNELIEIRSLSAANTDKASNSAIVGFEEFNLANVKENDRRRKVLLKEMVCKPILFLIICLLVPLFVWIVRRVVARRDSSTVSEN